MFGKMTSGKIPFAKNWSDILPSLSDQSMYIMIHTFGSCRSIFRTTGNPFSPRCSKAFALEHVYRNTPFEKNKESGILDTIFFLDFTFLFLKTEYFTKFRKNSMEKIGNNEDRSMAPFLTVPL